MILSDYISTSDLRDLEQSKLTQSYADLRMLAYAQQYSSLSSLRGCGSGIAGDGDSGVGTYPFSWAYVPPIDPVQSCGVLIHDPAPKPIVGLWLAGVGGLLVFAFIWIPIFRLIWRLIL